jgi:CAAX protease family protein
VPFSSKKVILALIILIMLALASAGVVELQAHFEFWKLAALFVCLALTLGVFVGLNTSAFAKTLRQMAVSCRWLAAALPFSMVIPYLVLALATGTFTMFGLAKLLAYIAAPTLLLLPDRMHHSPGIGWRDVAAMACLAVPVAAGWLVGIWKWPEELYVFRPFFCVCIGGYGFIVLRNLEGVGYRLLWRKADILDGSANFIAFSLLGIPLGLALQFIHPHGNDISAGTFLMQFVGIYLTIAIPEEFLFRGVLQNLLVHSLKSSRRNLYGIVIASVIFGLSHLHHAPVPNWRYALMATMAGLFYGNAFRTRQRISAGAWTHALVDTIWHFWF